YENQGITQEELSSMLSLDKTTIARNLKKLDDQGYIKRIKREYDKRSYSIDVTEKSLKIKDEVYRILHSWEEKLNSCLTNDESKQLIILLNKLNNINLLKEEEI
ncbi:MarR family transcriptional regulator, partial [Clostridium sp. IBUN13A]